MQHPGCRMSVFLSLFQKKRSSSLMYAKFYKKAKFVLAKVKFPLLKIIHLYFFLIFQILFHLFFKLYLSKNNFKNYIFRKTSFLF